MTIYTRDGGVVGSKIPISKKRKDEHRTLFGLYRGVVIRTVYPDDNGNTTKDRMEYVVKVKGQEYPNAINLRVGGGIYNRSERIRKHSEKALTGTLGVGTYDENLDGEIVYIMFLEGYGNTPIIVGAAQHPQQGKSKKYKRADGMFDETDFNGVQVQIDKDSNYTIKQIGRKDKDGTALNKDSIGAMIRLGGKDGDVFLKSSKFGFIHLDKDGGLKIVSKDGSLISMNATDGSLMIVSKDGNAITMDSKSVTVVEKSGKSAITLNDKSVQVTAKKVVVQSEEATLNSGAVNLGSNAMFTAVIYETMKTLFDAHIHASAVGPTGPPLPPNTMTLMELSPVTSAQAKYVKLRGNLA